MIDETPRSTTIAVISLWVARSGLKIIRAPAGDRFCAVQDERSDWDDAAWRVSDEQRRNVRKRTPALWVAP